MKRLSCRAIAAACLGLMTFAPATARADVLSVGVGAMGGGGVVGLSRPSNMNVQVGGVQAQDTSYPGFFGSAWGAGLSADARLLGFVGLEVDLFYAFRERGSGDLSLGPTSVKISIGQPSLHVPVLAKLILPVGPIRPFLAFGPEVVLPGTSSADVSPPSTLLTSVDAHADSYVMLTGALGIEVKLPLPAIDLRIPVSLRGSVNPGTSDKVVDRRDADVNASGGVTRVSYRSEWQYQGMFTAGLAYWF